MTTCRISLLSLVLTTLASSAAWGQSQVPGYAQPSSRQSAAAHAAPASSPAQPQEAKSGNWFRRLVIGQPEEATAKPATPQLSQQQPSSR
jgi:hypothetical protein